MQSRRGRRLAGAPARLAESPARIGGGGVGGIVIPLSLGVVYAVVLASNIVGAPGGFSSLQEVADLFSNRWLLLAGWVHYLAFDLFIGAWEVRDATERGVPRLLVAPCLVLTFLFGPIGLLCYHGVRLRGRDVVAQGFSPATGSWKRPPKLEAESPKRTAMARQAEGVRAQGFGPAGWAARGEVNARVSSGSWKLEAGSGKLAAAAYC